MQQDGDNYSNWGHPFEPFEKSVGGECLREGGDAKCAEPAMHSQQRGCRDWHDRIVFEADASAIERLVSMDEEGICSMCSLDHLWSAWK